jgi:hypothetical protein
MAPTVSSRAAKCSRATSIEPPTPNFRCTYFDQAERFGPSAAGEFVVQTYDLELQRSIDTGKF